MLPLKNRGGLLRKKGKVILVGAGPGDFGLLTLKAKEAIEGADVIVYDHLVNPSILSLAKKGAQLIYVGKEAGKHTLRQEEINKLLVQKAEEGLFVVRLKGGDPFVFGRGGEELEELAHHKIDFQVVPGISSAIAVPAYAGIPLTHRDYASSVAFVTGHEREEKTDSTINWEHLSRGVDTIVFLMGIGNAELIANRIISEGKSPDTPVAVIENGTTPRQRVLYTKLCELGKDLRSFGFRPPGIIVVGNVVELGKKLGWFDRLPLFSKRIVVTRPKDQAEQMNKALRSLGAEVIEFPTIQIVPTDTPEGLKGAISRLQGYHWLIFTSSNGVNAFFQTLFEEGKDSRALNGIHIACIGPKTALELLKHGIKADLIPEDYRAEGLVESLFRFDLKNKRVLIPRAQEAREILEESLMEMGAEVEVVPAYKTTIPQGLNPEATKAIFQTPPDLITFTSSSTVKNLFKILEEAQVSVEPILRESIAACIGPITAQTARKVGFKRIIQAKQYTVESLLDEITAFFGDATP